MSNIINKLDTEKEWESIYSSPVKAHKNDYPSENVISLVNKKFQNKDGMVALDLGCGWGNNMKFLNDFGMEVHGIDISQTAVNRLKPIYRNRVICGEISELPFSDGYFDFVLDRGSIQENSKKQILRIIDEVYRVLSPSGHFFSCMLKSKVSKDAKKQLFNDQQILNLLHRFKDVELNYQTTSFDNGIRKHIVHLIFATK
jgi:ubiquinone/menaquinone biosynthesis C-methylase UbiE